MEKRGTTVNSPIGEVPLDCDGSAIGAVRMNPELSYIGVPELLKEVIDQGSNDAWTKISSRIDYTYTCLGHALDALDGEIAFSDEMKARIETGQKLLFKPNLVSPGGIMPVTHGPGTIPLCTTWPFIAAGPRGMWGC